MNEKNTIDKRELKRKIERYILRATEGRYGKKTGKAYPFDLDGIFEIEGPEYWNGGRHFYRDILEIKQGRFLDVLAYALQREDFYTDPNKLDHPWPGMENEDFKDPLHHRTGIISLICRTEKISKLPENTDLDDLVDNPKPVGGNTNE